MLQVGRILSLFLSRTKFPQIAHICILSSCSHRQFLSTQFLSQLYLTVTSASVVYLRRTRYRFSNHDNFFMPNREPREVNGEWDIISPAYGGQEAWQPAFGQEAKAPSPTRIRSESLCYLPSRMGPRDKISPRLVSGVYRDS